MSNIMDKTIIVNREIILPDEHPITIGDLLALFGAAPEDTTIEIKKDEGEAVYISLSYEEEL